VIARPIELTVAEYSALRAEILQAQQARMVVLGLIVTMLSAVSGLVLGNADKTAATTMLTPGLVAFALLIVAIGVHFTSVLTRHMDMLGGYIRVHIEGSYEGDMWETVWTKHRQSLAGNRKREGKLPLGQSKVYALTYGALIAGVVVEYLIAEHHGSFLRALLVVVPAVIAAALATDLYIRRGARWQNPLGLPKPGGEE
jgi:hypothetical protein